LSDRWDTSFYKVGLKKSCDRSGSDRRILKLVETKALSEKQAPFRAVALLDPNVATLRVAWEGEGGLEGDGQNERPLNLFPDSSDRPGDVFIPLWFGGRGVALDVTIHSPTQVAQVSRKAANAGAALDAAKQRKLDRYLDRCRDVGINFVPLAVETFGG
jgi:hypothetical protein